MDNEAEVLSAEQIVAQLNSALVELHETKDYLTYATLLDLHLSELDRFTKDEMVLLLTALRTIMTENPDIVYEIGWDLPEWILRFIDEEWNYQGSLLKNAPLIKICMDCFEVLAKTGNPKELFIKVIEILSVIDIPDYDDEDEDILKTNRIIILDLKFHALVELLNASLKRINTIYPSKFLGMALPSMLKFFCRYKQATYHIRFPQRRLYLFARDYIPPIKPIAYQEEHNLTDEEAQKIEDDENYLQRKLLQSFIFTIYGTSFDHTSLNLSFKFYRNLQLTRKGILPINFIETNDSPSTSTYFLFLRLLALALSYDVDISEEFQRLQETSLELFSGIEESKRSDDEKIQDMVKLSVSDIVTHLYHPGSETIPKSGVGLLVLCSHFFYEEHPLDFVSTHALIAITIRFLSPGLISDKFRYFGSLDAILYLNWLNVVKESAANDYKSIPKSQMNLLLQILIFYSSVIDNPSVGLVSYTLLTRILTLIAEDSAYEFLIDTLTTAPFQNAKMAIITILKDLILRTRSTEVEDLTRTLEGTSLSSTDSVSTIKAAPPLPKRAFITLNKDRVEDIYALVRESIDETFPVGAKYDEHSAKLALGYLNLLIGIREKFPRDKLVEIVNVVDDRLTNDIESSDNHLQLLKLAQESLSSYLKT